MTWIMNLAFSNPTLEQKFRRLVIDNIKIEIGGWFIATWSPQTWPGKFNRKTFKNRIRWEWDNLDPERFYFIEHIILFPNTSKTPNNEWKPWDMKRAKELALANERLHHGRAVHFHTHPNGNPDLSPGDIGFAGAWLQETAEMSLMATVTAYPLRIWPHTINFGSSALPRNANQPHFISVGQFLSWSTGTLRSFLRE